MLESASLLLLANVIRQSIGLVSTIILARLLTPADYGLVALSALVVQFFDVFAQTGINQYILSRKELGARDVDTAWTVRLAVRLLLVVILVALASPIASFFDKPQLVPVLLVSAFVPMVSSLENPGLLLLRRAMSYKRIALLGVAAKLSGFCVGVTVAYVTRSYWALVIGEAAAALTFTAGSYLMHALRPRVSFEGFKSQWNFSKWTLARSVVGYTRARIDESVVGRFFGVDTLGAYSLSKQLSTMAHDQLTTAVADVLLTGMTRTREQDSDKRSGLASILVLQVCIMAPVVAGLWCHADVVVLALLGQGWSSAIPVLKALAPLALTLSLTTTLTLWLVTMDRVRDIFFIDLTAVLLLASVLGLVAASDLGIVTLAAARSALGVVTGGAFYWYVSRLARVPHLRLLLSVVPATIGCGAIVLLAPQFSWSAETGSVRALLAAVSGSVAAYAGTFLVLLHLMRRISPELALTHELLAGLVRAGCRRVLEVRS